MVKCWSINSPAACRGDHGTADCLPAPTSIWGVAIPCWSTLLAGAVAPWREEHMLQQLCWQDLWPLGDSCWGRLCLKDSLTVTEVTGAVKEELQPTGSPSPCWRRSQRSLSHEKVLILNREKSMRKEWQKMCGLTAAPIPCCSAVLEG